MFQFPLYGDGIEPIPDGIGTSHDSKLALACAERRHQDEPRVLVLDLETREKEWYIFVLPEYADLSTNRLSVLAPVGIALLGRRKRDIIELRVPGGINRLRIEHVYRTDIAGRRSRPHQTERPNLHLGSEDSSGRFSCVTRPVQP
jgi:hypothetical protein